MLIAVLQVRLCFGVSRFACDWQMTRLSEESGLNGARVQAEKREKEGLGLGWVGQQIPFLSFGLS